MNEALTIVIPVYNEEGNIFRIKDSLQQYMEQSSLTVLALFVDDGSKDGSLLLIELVCKEDARFGFISFQQNRGLRQLLKLGLTIPKATL